MLSVNLCLVILQCQLRNVTCENSCPRALLVITSAGHLLTPAAREYISVVAGTYEDYIVGDLLAEEVNGNSWGSTIVIPR